MRRRYESFSLLLDMPPHPHEQGLHGKPQFIGLLWLPLQRRCRETWRRRPLVSLRRRGPQAVLLLVSPLNQLAEAGHSTLPKASIRFPGEGFIILRDCFNPTRDFVSYGLVSHDNALAFAMSSHQGGPPANPPARPCDTPHGAHRFALTHANTCSTPGNVFVGRSSY